jgi:hypothetical protein
MLIFRSQTGGQDDLITIYSPIEGRIVARCQGHTSYVTSITFDRRRSNARGYRFGSVGEDGKILFWDFSAASLQRPRHGHAHHRLSIGSVTDLTAGGRRDETQTAGDEVALSGGGTYHGAPLRSDVAMLQPVMVSCKSQSLSSAKLLLILHTSRPIRPSSSSRA